MDLDGHLARSRQVAKYPVTRDGGHCEISLPHPPSPPSPATCPHASRRRGVGSGWDEGTRAGAGLGLPTPQGPSPSPQAQLRDVLPSGSSSYGSEEKHTRTTLSQLTHPRHHAFWCSTPQPQPPLDHFDGRHPGPPGMTTLAKKKAEFQGKAETIPKTGECLSVCVCVCVCV